MNSEDMVKKIQKVELNILKQMIPVFEQYGIEYALYYGSLIGAVRHKGFIPWDDDLDIVMTRESFEKLKSIFNKEAPSYLFLQDFSTDREYPCYTAKIRDSRTTMVEEGYRELKNMNHGMWIDIFILDYYDKSIISNLKCFIIRILQVIAIKRACANSIVEKRFLSIFGDSNRILKVIDSLVKSLDIHNKRQYYLLENKNSVEVDMIREFIFTEFEGVRVRIPRQYDFLLKLYYGDYMQLPPENQRKPSHVTNILSCDKPFSEFM